MYFIKEAKMKVTPLILAALVLGFFGGYAWRGLSLQSVAAEGQLLYEKPVDPAVTPTYPPGYFVVSRIYLADATPEMLGKNVIVTGTLGVLTHPETVAYPQVQSNDITVWTTPPVSPPIPKK